MQRNDTANNKILKTDNMEEQINYYMQKLEFEIDSWDLFESINRGDKIIVIDTRSFESYNNEHIPNSISLPHRRMSVETTSDFDKSILYVTYCDGIGCNASTKGALNMTKLGFRVKELIGGLDWWKRDGYETNGELGNQGKPITCGC
jgi:rhodanese-related sulfurtransferase